MNISLCVLSVVLAVISGSCSSSSTFTLTFGVYEESCPEAQPIIQYWVAKAMSDDPRIAASLLRLHFHDCFVNGCDASVLLDDTESFVGEKTAAPNLNSLKGFEVIDAIKSELEAVCPGTVSCADVLAVAARDSVTLSGGPSWEVQMGRRDSLSASKTAANSNIPSPNSNVTTLLTQFQNAGLTLTDLVALSGAHTIGKARCSTFNSRLKGRGSSVGGPDINLDYIESLQQLCLDSLGGNTTLANLDLATPLTFDNQYYLNLLSGEGLLASDQTLVLEDDSAREIVQAYADDPALFFQDFALSMVKMGSLQRQPDEDEELGEIRTNCRSVNKF